MEFIATCAAGFEELLAQELRNLAIERVRPLRGQVGFFGDVAAGYRACLWSRLASRVVAVLDRVDARTADELYEGAYALPWEAQLPRGATLAVDAHGTNAALRNSHFTALRVKDAIADRIAEQTGARLVTDVERPDLTVVVRLGKQRAVVGIDLAGEPLFHRDGRRQAGVQRLRPDYAAALLAAGGWPGRAEAEERSLVVLGGDGETIAEEAKAWLGGRAANLLRGRWGFEGWGRHDEAAWAALLDEADERAEAGERQAEALRPVLLPLDAADAHELSVSPDATDVLLCCDLSALRPGKVAEQAHALALAREAVAALGNRGRLVTLAPDEAVGRALGLEPTERRQVYLGSDEGLLCSYALEGEVRAAHAVSLRSGGTVSVELPASEQFVRRLEKDWRLRRKWARREDVGCCRIYDADLPDYAVAVDRFEPSSLLDEHVYGGSGGGPWASVAEYAAPREIDPLLAQTRLADAVAVVGPVLGVAPADVHLRQRVRAKGGSQYADVGGAREERRGRGSTSELALAPGAHLVDEGGLSFEVNFEGGLDVGLFLDTRDVRSLVREQAKQMRGSRRFLNLFAYTGSATCYAADGGALHTTTVDLSRPYLAWARRNMARNGFGGPEHEYVQADVLAWVVEQRHSPNRWDLVYLDPPTFSNSSRMRASSFDIQRDHVELLINVSRLLTKRAGLCIFCCNLRAFEPDVAALAKAGVAIEDVSGQTIPEDFARNQKVHHCYLVRRG